MIQGEAGKYRVKYFLMQLVKLFSIKKLNENSPTFEAFRF